MTSSPVHKGDWSRSYKELQVSRSAGGCFQHLAWNRIRETDELGPFSPRELGIWTIDVMAAPCWDKPWSITHSSVTASSKRTLDLEFFEIWVTSVRNRHLQNIASRDLWRLETVEQRALLDEPRNSTREARVFRAYSVRQIAELRPSAWNWPSYCNVVREKSSNATSKTASTGPVALSAASRATGGKRSNGVAQQQRTGLDRPRSVHAARRE
jgi:hypothetical protein